MGKKTNIKNRNKVLKSLILPLFASCFLFVLIIFGTFNSNFYNLTGNSVATNYICIDGYKLSGNSCIKEISATMLGDVDDNGFVDSDDVKMIEQYINDQIYLISQNFKAADINGDNLVNNEDKNILQKYLEKKIDLSGYVCPDDYSLNNNKCYNSIEANAVSKKNYVFGNVVFYNNSYWYILSEHTNYLTLFKKDPLTSNELGKYATKDNLKYNNVMYYKQVCSNNKCNDYNLSDIKIVLDNYILNIADDLEEINGFKIRLITLSELSRLGFIDNSNTKYYESTIKTPVWASSNGKEYWVMNNKDNTDNKSFIVTDYNNSSYIYETEVNQTLGLVRPVINLKKNKIK